MISLDVYADSLSLALNKISHLIISLDVYADSRLSRFE